MSPFGCWGLPAALLALFCCPGELVPAVPNLARASPEDGPLAPRLRAWGGAGPEVTEVWNAAAAWVQGAVPAWLPRDPGRVEEGVGDGKLAFWTTG